MIKILGRFPSGQRGQTVNLLADVFEGSNPSLPTLFYSFLKYFYPLDNPVKI
jgi:hypothetical protein